MTETFGFKTLGFIGLGAMGKPMLKHLADKLPEEARIWVYDVVEQIMNEMCAAYPGRVLKGTSAKDVAEHAVCFCPPTTRLSFHGNVADSDVGHHPDHGPRRLSRP